jgi:hypothetical protein
MADVVLAEFLAHCFAEAVRAREGADLYSRQLAEKYAEDPILKDFSVPRFRIPELEMSIPFVVTDAHLTRLVRLDVDPDAFVKELSRRADEVVRIRLTTVPRVGGEPPRPGRPSPETSEAIKALYAELAETPSRAEETTRIWWPEILRLALRGADLEVDENDRELRRLLEASTADTLTFVRARAVAGRTAVESLVVDPRTERVKDQTDATSVFTVTAHLVEEGFYLRTIRDEAGNERRIVDFE